MKNLLIIIALSGMFTDSCLFGQGYNYFIDLTGIESDKLKVNLTCPEITTAEARYSFPALIPGHHFLVNYGRFINDFKAYDSLGNLLNVERVGMNDFLIRNANRLFRISYMVNDTEDSEAEERVKGWSETNFVKDELFVINHGGVFGFFEGMKDLPVKVSYKKPEGLYGSTALKCIEVDKTTEFYIADDYHHLVDSPLMFSRPDTASMQIANCRIMVSCYISSGMQVADYLAKLIRPRMKAVAEFAGGELPVDNYVFLYYLQDYSETADLFYNETVTFDKIREQLIEMHGVPVLGALEHSNSSFHNLCYIGKNRLTDEVLISSAVHEFLHIYTPLNLRSNVRANFNYSRPVMSKHLWLYEGLTEYFSGLVMLKSGLTSFHDYLNYDLRLKMLTAKQYPSDMVFTEMSSNIFVEPYKSQFIQVYNRGAILAMLLDFEIMRLTNGEQDLRSVFFCLTDKYGSDRPFDEETFFDEFVRMVHPELRSFFCSYIEGTDSLDYKRAFETVGMQFTHSEELFIPESILTKGFGVEDVIEFFGAYTINEVTGKSPFKPGDKILSSDFGYNCLKPFLTRDGKFIQDGESVLLPVYRDNKWIDIKLMPVFHKEKYKYIIRNDSNKSQAQERLFNKWICN